MKIVHESQISSLSRILSYGEASQVFIIYVSDLSVSKVKLQTWVPISLLALPLTVLNGAFLASLIPKPLHLYT